MNNTPNKPIDHLWQQEGFGPEQYLELWRAVSQATEESRRIRAFLESALAQLKADLESSDDLLNVQFFPKVASLAAPKGEEAADV